MTDESGTIALVTGAAHGIGLEVCRQLAERGWTVVLTARKLERAREAAEGLAGLEGKVHARALNVADEASPRALAADLGWALGRVDVLVNNAGQAADWSETAGTADLREAHAVMEANLFGAWRTTQALLPLLRRSRRGRIVNVSSGAGLARRCAVRPRGGRGGDELRGVEGGAQRADGEAGARAA